MNINMSDYYIETVPPARLPVDEKEAKNFLRVEHDEDSLLINALTSAAPSQGEKYTNRCFITRTITGVFSGFELSNSELYPFITIRRAPLTSLTSFKVYTGGAWVDIDSDYYELVQTHSFPRILYSGSGLICDKVKYPLQAVFVCGYGSVSDVPDDIKLAIKQHINFLYENRGDVHAEGKLGMPIVSQSLYGKYRITPSMG